MQTLKLPTTGDQADLRGADAIPSTKPRRKRRRSLPPLLVDGRTAARLCGIGLRTWRTLDALGKLPRPVRLGARVLWKLAELRDWTAGGCPDRESWESMRNNKR